jgi:hypothetical protein
MGTARFGFIWSGDGLAQRNETPKSLLEKALRRGSKCLKGQKLSLVLGVWLFGLSNG